LKYHHWLLKWIILFLIASFFSACNLPSLTPSSPSLPTAQPVILTSTPNYADFTTLQQLPKVDLKATDRVEAHQGEIYHFVKVTNPSSTIAFFVHLKITKGANGEELLPVLWEDNYFMLLPGESREIRANYYVDGLGYTSPTVEVDTWNNR
jgi:exo-1,4-beta-D-glucosaminidase